MGRRDEFSAGYEVIPPTAAAVEHIHRGALAHQMHQLDESVERKDKAVATAKARNSAFAMGTHAGIQNHLEHDHGAWPEDVEKDHGELARWHQSWHADGGEDHTH